MSGHARAVHVGDNVATIAGVAPKGFTGTEPGTITDISSGEDGPIRVKERFVSSSDVCAA